MKHCCYTGLMMLLLLNVEGAPAGNLSGTIRGRLTTAASPYTVTADITLPAGDTLRIEPGVKLEFAQATSFLVKGELKAIGVDGDSIYFQSAASTPAAGDWNGIFFSDAGTGLLSRVVVRHAASGISCDSTSPEIRRSLVQDNINGIDCKNGAGPSIHDNTIAGNLNAGIRAINASPEIKNNTLRENSIYGFESAIVLENSNAAVVLNFIIFNGSSGIDLLNCQSPGILQNTVVANDMGITLSNSQPKIINNIVALNGAGISAETSTPNVSYNNVWANSGGNFYGMDEGVGINSTVNARGDSVDSMNNMQINPFFYDQNAGDFRIKLGSPCIDAGDPLNPAGIAVLGEAPDIGAHENDELTVPVELISFFYEDGALRWRTASETNNLGFYIQAAESAAGPFRVLGFVEGHGTSAVPHEYRFTLPARLNAACFRLRQVDFDGTAAYSDIIHVPAVPQNLSLSQNFPNPFRPGTNSEQAATEILVSVPAGVRAGVTIFDVLGRQVKVLWRGTAGAGSLRLVWDGRNDAGIRVAPGVYFYILQTPAQRIRRSLIVSGW